MVILTDERIQAASHNGALTKAQFAVLGIAWPPEKGWRKRVAGLPMSDEAFRSFQNAAGTLTRATQHRRAMVARVKVRRAQKTAQRCLGAYAINSQASAHMRSIVHER